MISEIGVRPIEGLFSKRLCFTVTSGRSRTKLLAILLREAAGLCAEHEPAPRFNYVLRAVLEYPEAAAWWLAAEKLPAIAEIARSSGTYIELSHLTCKGFVEPLLELGLRPDFLDDLPAGAGGRDQPIPDWRRSRANRSRPPSSHRPAVQSLPADNGLATSDRLPALLLVRS